MPRKEKASAKPKAKAPRAQLATPGASEARSGFDMPHEKLERFLLTGEARGALEDYYGPEAYTQLRDLARAASTRSVRGGPRVLILPGIMGSTLAKDRFGPFDDVLWIDPLEIALGRITEL
ncbi:MAG: hypothetical protein JWN34_1262, partial [Bryobacterales bacterium]|nr:hypothetical protein [Bryobacterales bacterium]